MKIGFSARLIRWHNTTVATTCRGRTPVDPYRVWLSEVMLQQTQVATVLPYYERFLQHFPDFDALAAAPLPEVMALWSGLGYYARARNLHACARAVVREHGGRFPHDADSIVLLPGIGRSTANSIATFCFGAQAPITRRQRQARAVPRLRHRGLSGHRRRGKASSGRWRRELMPKP
jgi:A/G-specific adenine glycosylase